MGEAVDSPLVEQKAADLGAHDAVVRGEQLSQLVQDDQLVSKIHIEELPPNEYYDLLGPRLVKKSPGLDPPVRFARPTCGP